MAKKIEWEMADPLPRREPPPGGWQAPKCTFDSHKWVMEVEDGRVSIRCADPHDGDLIDPAKPTPVCLHDWQPEDFHTPDEIPVTLTYVDDSTTAGPWGPAEYGYYIEVRVVDPKNQEQP